MHRPLLGGLLHLVQRGGDWTGAAARPAQVPPRCTKCYNPPVKGQCINTINHCIAVLSVRIKGLIVSHYSEFL